ncbi:MAG: TaqI-like C-terminal specificity domain-containing protein [Bacteroidota bacterium]
MQLTLLSPRKSLNKAYLKVKPSRSVIELFKKNLIHLLDDLNESESEEHSKNDLGDFLKNTFYHPKFYINTKDRTDLVIHNGPDSKSLPSVLIEAKKPSNKTEMIRPDNLNTKAFQELILYYLRERIINHNLEIKHLVATNVYEWYVFDANFFEKTFAQNKTLVKRFTDFEEGRLAGKTTDFFYKEIAEPFLASLTSEIYFTWFDFREYDKPLRNEDKKDDSKLIALYKLLSPEHLLKLPFVNDSNSLDKAFYTELLHIIGLTETKEGSKKLIGRKLEGQRDPGSMIENTMIQIDSLDMISRISKPTRFGENPQERLFNVSLELVFTWINRILFLKLLEAQLVKCNKGGSSFSFLTIEKVQGYDALNSLFFRVLAKKIQDRDPAVAGIFEKVPYLNSSLFEPTELERETIFISNLQDDCLIPIHSGTVLKNNTGKRLTGSSTGLDYLFAFLDAYDFSGEGAEEIQEENKTLINSSVLGLIFEKINGYKDGSFFTPGFITMYMCRETIRRAVIQKFNERKAWNCANLEGLYEKIEDKKEANEIINQLKICDPAVGSGHFLVSALNEIIAIKSDLKILADKDGKRLKEYHVEVANDELIITDEDGELFEYYPRSRESQRVQEAIFSEKQTIIENCLFGVDINPNSVKICRLRLWIELLKNSYYKAESNYTELETLPNIDINIKCGNSLISRYALDADIKQALKKSKWNIDSYRLAVMTYRNARGKEEKREMENLIKSIKSDFETEVAANDKRLVQLKKLNGDLFTHTNQTFLFERSKKELTEWNKKVNELTGKIKKLETELDEIKNNKVYENAFEWRFEFPEVLNDEGDFVGFDVVIGNPPYIPLESFTDIEKVIFRNKFPQFERKYETSVMFMIEGFWVVRKTGLVSYIAPQTWQTGENYSIFRKFLITGKGINQIINLPFNTFEDAYVDTGIYSFSNYQSPSYAIYNFDKKAIISDLRYCAFEIIDISKLKSPDYKIILDKNIGSLISKFSEPKFISLGTITKSTQGLSGSRFSKIESDICDENSYPFLSKGNVYNYSLIKAEVYMISLSEMKSLKQFYEAEDKILIRRIINRQDRLSVAYCDEKLVFKKDINPFIPIDQRFQPLYLLGILCSRFISYLYLKSSSIATKDDFRQTTLAELRKLPIPVISEQDKRPIIENVAQILAIKNANPNADTSALEQEIDQLVYTLYGLTEEEIKIIEQSF